MACDSEAQEDELLALESIYDSQIFVATTEGEIPGGQFVAHLDLPPSFFVKVTTNETGICVFLDFFISVIKRRFAITAKGTNVHERDLPDDGVLQLNSETQFTS